MKNRANRRNGHLVGRREQVRKQNRFVKVCLGLAALIVLVTIIGVRLLGKESVQTGAGLSDSAPDLESESIQDRLNELRPELDVQLLDINEYSRAGLTLKSVNGIVIHYTANPGSTAQQNRDYFNNLATSHTAKVSSHFVIGLDGEIIQCIPCSEMAYASNTRNSDTIAIECCHEDDSGKFNDATYDSAVQLTAWLAVRYDLTTDDILRHYDITGKDCPKYFVEHEDAWEQFLQDVDTAMVTLMAELNQ